MLSSHTNHNEYTNNKSKKDNKQNNNTNDAETPRSAANNSNNSNTGTSYLQTQAVPGTYGRLIWHIMCFKCNKKGHYTDNCPEDNPRNEQQHVQANDPEAYNNEGATVVGDGNVQHLQVFENDNTEGNSNIVHFSWTQEMHPKNQDYKDTDILLDTGSTFSVFKNHQMVLNIHDSDHVLKAYTNGGRQDPCLVADLPGFFTL